MLSPYYGAFMYHPIPLHLELNYCSHICSYCFANLNSPKRRTDMSQVMGLMKDYKNRDSLVARLLQDKYPVLMSNLVDPFAASNYKQTLPFLEWLTGEGIPVSFQTRGGLGVDDAMQVVGRTMWYVSIPYVNEEIKKQLEPASPTLKSRWELVDKIIARGDKVMVGINPYDPEFLPGGDYEALLKQCVEHGVTSIAIYFLHLNRDQLAAAPERDRPRLTELAKKRDSLNRLRETDQEIQTLEMLARCYGLKVLSDTHQEDRDVWSEFREVYPKTFPTWIDLIPALERVAPGTPEIVGYDAAQQLFEHFGLPTYDFSEGSKFIGSVARTFVKKHVLPKRMTFEQIARLMWNEGLGHNLTKGLSFSRLVQEDGDGFYDLVDEDGNAILQYQLGMMDVDRVAFEGAL
jgi:DNA repair photolyase